MSRYIHLEVRLLRGWRQIKSLPGSGEGKACLFRLMIKSHNVLYLADAHLHPVVQCFSLKLIWELNAVLCITSEGIHDRLCADHQCPSLLGGVWLRSTPACLGWMPQTLRATFFMSQFTDRNMFQTNMFPIAVSVLCFAAHILQMATTLPLDCREKFQLLVLELCPNLDAWPFDLVHVHIWEFSSITVEVHFNFRDTACKWSTHWSCHRPHLLEQLFHLPRGPKEFVKRACEQPETLSARFCCEIRCTIISLTSSPGIKMWYAIQTVLMARTSTRSYWDGGVAIWIPMLSDAAIIAPSQLAWFLQVHVLVFEGASSSTSFADLGISAVELIWWPILTFLAVCLSSNVGKFSAAARNKKYPLLKANLKDQSSPFELALKCSLALPLKPL